jgi:hypothetical protein
LLKIACDKAAMMEGGKTKGEINKVFGDQGVAYITDGSQGSPQRS